MDTITSVTADSLTVSGSGFFSSDLETFEGFIDPNAQAVLYVPGSAADYTCDFTIDAPASYAASAELGNWSSLYLASFESGVLFDWRNQSPISVPVALSGTFTPGHYFFRANASLGGIPFSGHEQGSISN